MFRSNNRKKDYRRIKPRGKLRKKHQICGALTGKPYSFTRINFDLDNTGKIRYGRYKTRY